jgi:hypothetical protein
MSVQVLKQAEVLEFIAVKPRSHLSLSPAQRREIGPLWTNQLIRLAIGDVWVITQQGQAAINGQRTLH